MLLVRSDLAEVFEFGEYCIESSEGDVSQVTIDGRRLDRTDSSGRTVAVTTTCKVELDDFVGGQSHWLSKR